MATADALNGEAGFELVALPEPMAVRDPDTGAIVDGYRLTVRSKTSGATATLELPKSRYSADYLKAQAEAALEPLDASIAAFGARGLSGAQS